MHFYNLIIFLFLIIRNASSFTKGLLGSYKEVHYKKPEYRFCENPFNFYFYRYWYVVTDLNGLKSYPDAWYQLPKKLQDDYSFNPPARLRECFSKTPDEHSDCELTDICWALHDEFKGVMNSELVTMYWRYYNCYQNKDTFYNCPSPCNKIPNPCANVINSRGHCSAYYDPNIQVKLSHKAEPIRRIFQLHFKCDCIEDFFWNNKKRMCVDKGNCNIKCYNKGTCVKINNESKCLCHPAFKGPNCLDKINPCEEIENNVFINSVCGGTDPKKCRRSEKEETGFDCNCEMRQGYMKGPGLACKKIEYCPEYKQFCYNGATCVELNGSSYERGFKCKCRSNYEGRYCERAINNEIIKWNSFGPWSECSSPCSKGHRISTRECTVPYMCPGSESRIESCDNSYSCGYKRHHQIYFEINNETNMKRLLDNISYYQYLDDISNSAEGTVANTLAYLEIIILALFIYNHEVILFILF